MDKARQKALEAAGMRVTTVSEFLGLTPEEEKIVELRVAVSLASREARKRNGMTQGDVAKRMHSTQGRVAKIESGAPNVSLDLMVKCLLAAGGELEEVFSARRGVRKATPRASRAKSSKGAR